MSPLLGSCCGIGANGPYYSSFLRWIRALSTRGFLPGPEAWSRRALTWVTIRRPTTRNTVPRSLVATSTRRRAWRGSPTGTMPTPDTAATRTTTTRWPEPRGDPAVILDLFRRRVIPTDAMTEGVVDIYPMPGLVSGALAGGYICGAPHKTPQTQNIATFPAFVRYLLNDRLVYWGLSNDDYQLWGQGMYSRCNYASYCVNGLCRNGIERQILLTGARIEMYPPNGNAILDAIVAERQRVNWWPRQPRYLATRRLNLTTIPASSQVEVANFQDKNGASLLAISNPNVVSGLSFTANGVTVAVPTQKVAIIDRGSVGTPPAAPNNLVIKP